METNKMREQFEVAFVAKYGFGRLAASANADAHAMYEAAKWAWQASREAVLVELPDAVVGARRYQHAEAAFAHKEGIDECRAAIEAQGLKVTP